MFVVPGEPADVKVTPVNSTTIHVSWKPPAEKNKNGIIRGYHIHLHEMRDEVGGFIEIDTNWQPKFQIGILSNNSISKTLLKSLKI